MPLEGGASNKAGRMKGLIGLLLLLDLRGSVWAQRQYSALPFPPYEIYEAVLGYAEASNLEGISKTLPYLKPLFNVLLERRDKDFETIIRRALDAKNPNAAKAALLEMIFEDMLFNLEAADGTRGVAQYREALQMAFMDYHFLSPAVRSSDPSLDDAVLREFKMAYRLGKNKRILELASGVEHVLSVKAGLKGPE